MFNNASKVGARSIWLGQGMDLFGANYVWRIDKQRDMVFFNRQADFPGAGSAMVRHNHKYSIFKPWLFFCLLNHLRQGVISIFHSAKPSAAALAFSGHQVDFALREGEGWWLLVVMM